jgi:hypothetical protein
MQRRTAGDPHRSHHAHGADLQPVRELLLFGHAVVPGDRARFAYHGVRGRNQLSGPFRYNLIFRLAG